MVWQALGAFSASSYLVISVNIYISQEQLTQESMEGVEAAEGQTSWGRPGAQVVLVLVIAVVRFCCYDCSCCCCSCSCHLLLLLQLSYFVVITVCDRPPKECLGLRLFLFLLWQLLDFVVSIVLAVVIFCCYKCLWQTSWGRPGAQVVLIFVVVLVVNLCCCWCQPGTQVVCIQT